MFGRHRQAVGQVVGHRLERRNPALTEAMAQLVELMAQLVAEVTGVAVDGDRPDLVGVAAEQFAGPGLEALQAGWGAKVTELGRQKELVAQGQGRRAFEVATQGEHPQGRL